MTDWEAGLFEDTRYPAALRHALFVWDDGEEDLQCAALGWFLLWRKRNTFVLDNLDSHFIRPIEEPFVWLHLKERILDWAWAEQGGLDLDATHTTLLERHHYRITWSPIRKPKNLPSRNPCSNQTTKDSLKKTTPKTKTMDADSYGTRILT